ncbi:MAG TPA: hypothetical protein VKD22_15170, partial [Ramlibacter sp.]|nr:hypothetical protein [Ramlibacter sp.]
MPDFSAQPAVLVDASTAGDQQPPLIAALAGGGYAVVWSSSTDQNIYAQRYDAAGAPAGGPTFVGHVASGSPAAVAGLNDGGLVVLFTDATGTGNAVFAQRLDAAGQLAGGATVVAASTDHSIPVTGDGVQPLPDGGYLATYHTEYLPPSPLQNGTLYAQAFDASGAATASAVTITALTGELASSTTVLPDGGWLTTWSSFVDPHDGLETFTKQFSSAGTVVTGATINPDPAASEVMPSDAVLADGNSVVVWSSLPGLQAQLFDPG